MKVDTKLVAASKKGDKKAFSKLYTMIYKEMYRYAYCMLSNEHDAEDAVSETVLDAYKTIKNLRDDELFCNWIFKILSNKCLKKRKQYADEKACIHTDDAERRKGDDTVMTAAVSYDYENRQDIRIAFEVLNNEEKEIVSMAVFAGYKSREIAEYLGLKATTVRSKLSRALAKMKPVLK